VQANQKLAFHSDETNAPTLRRSSWRNGRMSAMSDG
jgi:hypothetical protein